MSSLQITFMGNQKPVGVHESRCSITLLRINLSLCLLYLTYKFVYFPVVLPNHWRLLCALQAEHAVPRTPEGHGGGLLT